MDDRLGWCGRRAWCRLLLSLWLCLEGSHHGVAENTTNNSKTLLPTNLPTVSSSTALPTFAPTALPTFAPTALPTFAPTASPTVAGSNAPILARVNPSSGTVGVGATITIDVILPPNSTSGSSSGSIHVVSSSPCAVNGVDVRDTFSLISSKHYQLVYVVEEGDADVVSGEDDDSSPLAVDCILEDAASRYISASHWLVTGCLPNTLSIDASSPVILTAPEALADDGHLVASEGSSISGLVQVTDNGAMSSLACEINGRGAAMTTDDGTWWTWTYAVSVSDDDRSASQIPFECTAYDAANNSATLSGFVRGEMWVIDTHPPVLLSAAIYNASGVSLSEGDAVQFALTVADVDCERLTVECMANGRPASMVDSSGNHSTATVRFHYEVSADDDEAAGGSLPFTCTVADSTGHVEESFGFLTGLNVAVHMVSPQIVFANVTNVTGTAPNGRAVIGSVVEIALGVADVDGDLRLATCASNASNNDLFFNLGGGEQWPLAVREPPSAANAYHGLYVAAFQVTESSYDRDAGDLRIDCELVDGSGLRTPISRYLGGILIAVDASPPNFAWSGLVATSQDPARVGSSIVVTLKDQDAAPSGDVLFANAPVAAFCTINGQDVSSSFFALDLLGFYSLSYSVESGDSNVLVNETLDVDCLLEDASGNRAVLSEELVLPFVLDANEPVFSEVSLDWSSDSPAHEGSVIEIALLSADIADSALVAAPSADGGCSVNGHNVSNTLRWQGGGKYLLTYVVSAGDDHWAAGDLAVECVIVDDAGNSCTLSGFTTPNKLAGTPTNIINTPVQEAVGSIFKSYVPSYFLVIGFFVIVVASNSISSYFPLLHLPPITGYLVSGILAGPYCLNLIPEEEVRLLRFVDEVAMAYIALSAGSKYDLHQLKAELRSITIIATMLTLTEYIVGVAAILVCIRWISFLEFYTDSSEALAIALLAGSMMIARSPASVLASVSLNHAKGHFTNVCLGVTVLLDVLCLPIYSVSSLAARLLLSDDVNAGNDGMEGDASGGDVSGDTATEAGKVIGILLCQLVVAVIAGIALGTTVALAIRGAPGAQGSRLFYFHGLLVSLTGFSVYLGSRIFNEVVGLPLSEPILINLVAGCYITNKTPFRERLQTLIRSLNKIIYVSFFTLTGAALDLSIMLRFNFVLFATVLAVSRIFAIYIGSAVGTRLANERLSERKFHWMAYVTQAGVTLGLAKSVQLDYPGWGGDFATMIVAVVIINQMIGPPLLTQALGATHNIRNRAQVRKHGEYSRAVLLGDAVECQALMARLEKCDWRIKKLSESAVTARLGANCGGEPSICVRADARGRASPPSPGCHSHYDGMRKNPLRDADAFSRVNGFLEDVFGIWEKEADPDIILIALSSDAHSYEVCRILTEHAEERLSAGHSLTIIVQLQGEAWAKKFSAVKEHWNLRSTKGRLRRPSSSLFQWLAGGDDSSVQVIPVEPGTATLSLLNIAFQDTPHTSLFLTARDMHVDAGERKTGSENRGVEMTMSPLRTEAREACPISPSRGDRDQVVMRPGPAGCEHRV